MFQYAAARRLAAVHSTEVRIDTSWYERIPEGATSRVYELDVLRHSGRPATRWDLIGTEGVRNTPLHELPVALFRKARPRYRFVAERHFHFDPSVLSLPDDVCLFGYWISEKYFLDIAEVIREEFRFRNPPSPENQALLETLTAVNSVAVHVRRGDYANKPEITQRYGLPAPDYYARAAALIAERDPNPVFFVFSDDLDWARENLELGPDVVYVDHNRGEASPEDLRLMANSKHNVIANSGFSWWGAWLNANPQKIVCAPEAWMADPAFDTSDVVPESWFRL
jgi:hypothetical protein